MSHLMDNLFQTWQVDNFLTRSEKLAEFRGYQEELGIAWRRQPQSCVLIFHWVSFRRQDSDITLETLRISVDDHPSTICEGFFKRSDNIV